METEVTLVLAVLVTVSGTSTVAVEVTVVVAIGIFKQEQALEIPLGSKLARKAGILSLVSTSRSLTLAGGT